MRKNILFLPGIKQRFLNSLTHSSALLTSSFVYTEGQIFYFFLNIMLYSRKFKFGYNQTIRESAVPKRLHTFISTLATGIAMIAVDSNRY